MSAMASPSGVNGLKGVSLFSGHSPVALSRLGLTPASRVLAPGEDLFQAGETRERAWFVLSGWLRIRVHSPGGHESTVGLLGPGEMCGAGGNFGQSIYPYTATALTDATVAGISSAAFERWLSHDARAAAAVVDILAARLLETVQLRAINAERADVRLSLTLRWLSGKLGPRIPATRALLADLTGLRAETCSRVLSGLRRRGILRVSPRLIQVLKPGGLEARS